VSGDTTMAARATRQFQPSFYFWMILVMFAFVFLGFGMHSLFPAMRGEFPPAPPIVHIHAVIMGSWMVLLLAQTSLICSGNLKLHRSLGMYAIAHATALMFTGALIQLVGSKAGVDNGSLLALEGVYLGGAAVLGFGSMFVLAIRNTKRPEVHRPMMLFAMLPVIVPGLNRFWFHGLGLDDFLPLHFTYPTLWAMAAAILIHEWRKTGRINGYLIYGTAWIVLQGVLHEPVNNSAWFMDFGSWLLSVVQYR